MKIGYVRVSSADQNTERQEVLMEQLNVEKIFVDKLSGKNKDRPQLKEMLNFVREGDVLVVESISRLARNTRDLLEIVDTLTNKKVYFVSQKETIDTTTAMGRCILTIFGAIAELERSYILDRQREGIAIAKEKGKFKGRKPKEIDRELWDKYYPRWKNGRITATYFIKQANMCPATFYKLVRKFERESVSI